MRLSQALLAAAALWSAVSTTTLAALPTPPPGGANQRAGTSGPLSAALFNGRIRLRKMKLERKTEDGDREIVFSTLVANGTQEDRVTYLDAHLVDADGVTIEQTSGDPAEGPCSLPPGSACRQTFRFRLPSDDFRPVKVLLEEAGNGPQPVFRVMLENV